MEKFQARFTMRRAEKRGRHRALGFGTLILIGILILALAGCESILGPKSDDSSSSDEDEEARIIVTNQYDNDLDIYMDGIFQFFIGNGSSIKIRDVSLDEHDLEAKLASTSTVVDTTTIDVTSYTDYTWTIEDSPDINVTNAYGVTLKIYLDGNFQFEVVDEENRWIMNVSMGEHFLKATKSSDGKEIASITIDIEENRDYSWTIQ
jgi:hypothetical protein